MGGGFCKIHGPFDPPHRECPYCAREQVERQMYGPPEAPDDAPAPEPDAAPHAPDEAALTEMMPRDDAPPGDAGAPANGSDPATTPLGWLIVKQPPAQRGTVLPLRANQSIGRAGDVRWDDPRLSRQHARVTVEVPADAPDGSLPVFHIWPFGPTNPVRVNGREIRGATPLQENDEIQLGDTLFIFKVLSD
jgi:hypothetical protein